MSRSARTRTLWQPGEEAGEAAAPRPALIVELAGPAGAGKTTLARALHDALGARDCPVALAASARPAEHRDPGPVGAVAERMSKLGQLVPLVLGRAPEGPGAELLSLLPPRGAAWRLRYRRYLAELDRRWAEARRGSQVVIFDQGYRAAVAALAVLGPGVESPALLAAAARSPRPDLLVRLDAPRDLLAARLQRRLGSQSRLERLFELEAETTLRQVDALTVIDARLGTLGVPTVAISSTDPESLSRAVSRLVAAVTGLRARGRP